MKIGLSSIYGALRSKTLGFALLAAFGALCALGILIPQRMSEYFYSQRFSPALARLIADTGADRLFSGWTFLVLSAAAYAHLAAGAYHAAALGADGPRKVGRLGPLFLRVGGCLLLLGLTLLLGRGGIPVAYAKAGEAIPLPDGTAVLVMDIEEHRRPGGRLASWTTTVKLLDDTAALGAAGLEVSGDFDTLGETGYADPRIPVPQPALKTQAESIAPPLFSDAPGRIVKTGIVLGTRAGGYTLRQKDLRPSRHAVLTDPIGIERILRPGEKMAIMGGSILLMDLGEEENSSRLSLRGKLEPSRFLLEMDGSQAIAEGAVGASVGPMVFSRIAYEPYSGIEIAPAPRPIHLGLAIGGGVLAGAGALLLGLAAGGKKSPVPRSR